MLTRLRTYQHEAETEINAAWAAGNRNVLFVMACGGGKTPLIANTVEKHVGACVVFAHRQELVGQVSRTLARWGVKHRIIGPPNIIKSIIQSHIQLFGRDFYDPNSRVAVAGVDTLVRRADSLKSWANQVTLWVCDESHHCIKENKWGKAISMLPNAKGLGTTATPERTDGKGLGRKADGVFDVMVLGPDMRTLINGLPDWDGKVTRYLTDYRIFCPPSDLDLSTVATGADGDFIRGQLAKKTRESNITGHIVEHYLKIAPGKLGITFAPDVETATEWSKLFNQAGVPCEVLTAKTPDRLRIEIMKRFERRELLMLTNCDILGEGVDVPAVEVVIMGRATQSYNLYVQQFGRMDRLMEGKEYGILIDHVNNVLRHGLPDRPRVWSLDRKDRRTATRDPDAIPMRTCTNQDRGDGWPCLSPYERFHNACPFCGHIPQPASRTSPEMVDGCLYELDPEVLAAMRGEVHKIDRHPDAVRIGMLRAGYSEIVARSQANIHRDRQTAQQYLREALALWMGYQQAMGRDEREAQKRFYFRHGKDVLSVQALGRAEADEMTQVLCEDLMRLDRELRGVPR